MYLNRRIEKRAELESEIEIWKRRCKTKRETIQWMFTYEKAPKKMRHAYPQITSESDASAAAA